MTPARFTLSRRCLLIGGTAVAMLPRIGMAQTPVATPVAAGGFVDRIDALMALVPAGLAEVTESSVTPLTYADLVTQFAAVGLPRPAGDQIPEGIVDATLALPLSHAAFQYAMTPAWHDTFGFWPLSIDQVLIAGEPPNTVAVFAGIDTGEVTDALVASGYAEVLQETGGEYYSFGDDISPSTEVGRLGVGTMNQAVVRDGIAIFTRDEATIQQVTQVMAGLAPSVLEAGSWPALMATFAADTAGTIGVAPAGFARSGDASAIQHAAFGVRAGASGADMPAGGGQVQIRIRYTDAATATAEAEAIPERWASMTSVVNDQPFSELMTVESAVVAEGDPTVAAIDFRIVGPVGRWYQMVVTGDLGALVPQG